MTDRCEVKVLQDHDGRAGYGLCGRPVPCPDHVAGRPGWAYGPSVPSSADAALAAQDAEVDAMQAEEDEGTAAWPNIQEDEVSRLRPLLEAVALDENCLPLLPGKEPWRVRDLSGLEWAFKQKAEADKEAAENLARAEAEVAELEREIAVLRLRAENINKPLVKRAAYFESHIRVYAEQNRAELLGSGKRKSRKFLHGELAWKDRPEGHYRKLDGAENERALLAWAQQLDDGQGVLVARETVESVNLDAAKEYLTKISGVLKGRQVAPGLEWVPPGVDLKVKTVES